MNKLTLLIFVFSLNVALAQENSLKPMKTSLGIHAGINEARNFKYHSEYYSKGTSAGINFNQQWNWFSMQYNLSTVPSLRDGFRNNEIGIDFQFTMPRSLHKIRPYISIDLGYRREYYIWKSYIYELDSDQITVLYDIKNVYRNRTVYAGVSIGMHIDLFDDRIFVRPAVGMDIGHSTWKHTGFDTEFGNKVVFDESFHSLLGKNLNLTVAYRISDRK